MKGKDQCIIISGGSKGLGLALVLSCLERGFRVATFARKQTNEIKEVVNRYRDLLYFTELDGTDEPGLEKFIDRASNFGGGSIYALINNAAIGQDHLLTHLSSETIKRILMTNVHAPIVLTKMVIRKMILAGQGGRIINVSSICGSRGFSGLTVYSATKGAIDAFTRSLAREVGARGILVNSVAPGFFSSEMSASLGDDQLQTIERRTPTGKLTDISQVIPTINFLLLENTNITGQVLAVDGGMST